MNLKLTSFDSFPLFRKEIFTSKKRPMLVKNRL